MSNSYFRFKQFTVHQERSAMKVCTDACLFGAWVANRAVEWELKDTQAALDIGAGTGLLSLMLAQQFGGSIDAVELDEAAALQATDNMEASPWRERMQVLTGDIRTLHLGRSYDLILSNPPFYENDLKSADAQRNLALHSHALSLQELVHLVLQHLALDGRFAVLLPWHRKEALLDAAAKAGLYAAEIVAVSQSAQHGFFRVMACFGRKETLPVNSALTIREGAGYSNPFTQLLSSYYLAL